MRRKKGTGQKKRFPLITLILLCAVAGVALVSASYLDSTRTVTTRAESNCPGKLDVTDACNPACCDPADAKTCPDGEVCSIQNGYCKSGYSCKPKENKVKRDCTQNICAWISCKPDDPTCCDTDTDPKCIYCDSNEKCVGVNISSSSSSSESSIPNDQRSNTCFSLAAEVDARKDGNGFTFYPYLKVESPPGGGDGHIQLFVDGAAKGTNWGWNRGVHNPFVINPEFTETRHLDSGSVTVNYAVKIDECNTRGNYLNLTCRYKVTGGVPTVEGPSCACKNCAGASNNASSQSNSSQSARSSSAGTGRSSSVPLSSSSASASSSSPASSSPASSSSVPETEQVFVTVEYAAGAGVQPPRAGGACLVKAGVPVCLELDAAKTIQTIPFTINKTDRKDYTAAQAYLIDEGGNLYQKETAVSLEQQKNYAIRISYKLAEE